MTDEKLMEILHENLQAREIARAKQNVIDGKSTQTPLSCAPTLTVISFRPSHTSMTDEPVAWRRTVESYCARIIQRNYRHHLAWMDLKKESWRARLYLKKEQEQV